LDQRRAKGEMLGPLFGLPVAVKDNLATSGLRTTCGSRILENFVPPYSATVIERLEQAGAVLLGKTNCDEFAMGSSTENSAFFPTRNPWDLERVPGGSSGGSATAVASRQVFLSLGTDTGGSVRQPASFCGLCGFKPTYGRVSRYGLIAFASSLDQVGAFARNVRDCALLLEVIAGYDPLDSTSLREPVPPYLRELKNDPGSLRIGFASDWLAMGLSPEVESAFHRALDTLRGLGFTISPISLPHSHYALPTYYLIAPAEASANLARFDGIRYGLRVPGENLKDLYQATRGQGFGAEVKRRIMLGTYALSAGYRDAFYLKAQQVRTLIRRDFERAFGAVDLIAVPTTPSTAFRLGEKVNDPLAMYMADLFTIPVSLAGIPSLSLPMGIEGGLPMGLQLVGPALAESRILQVAWRFQQATGFHDLVPPLAEALRA
jgi:aspartyl-tRNA(Asn)/glutamyl-tRNA(Gln) amidotransferase subunit A